MKLAFSTLGCPGWPWKEIYATAKDMGLDGIEIRGIENQIYVPKIKVFNEANQAATITQLKQSGMEISMLTSSASLGLPEVEQNMAEAKDYIDFAAKLDVRFVRVMIVPVPEVAPAAVEQAKELYNQLCEYAKGKNVRVLIETNGILADSSAMKAFIADADPQTRGVLWDVHHPYRYFGESPYDTYAALGKEICYVHVKDSVMLDGKVQYRMMGYGDVPVYDALQVLHQNGYEGYVSLEWVKRWNPDLQEPGIVFYHFQSYMEALLEQLGQK